MKAIILLVVVFINHSYAKSILVIGDSHMANPLGAYMINHLASLEHDIVVLGHASSAPIDWINDKTVYHRGGTYNAAYNNKKYYRDPNPKHWREKVSVPKLSFLLKDMLYHSSWKEAKRKVPDIVIVELGANDAKVIADKDGNRSLGYRARFNAAKKMSETIINSGAACFWILPPNGEAKSARNQKVLYDMLIGATKKNCTIYKGSNQFKAIKSSALKCDGYHFHCSKKEKLKAFNWSKDIMKYIEDKI